MNRRLFLKESAVLVTALSRPEQLFGALDRTGNGRKLVLVELAGGADGLNAVVPFTSEHYYTSRPKLAVPEKATLKINNTIGLHPALTPLKALYDDGAMAIVQGVGYPHPSRCHWTARRIWYSGNVEHRMGAKGSLSCLTDPRPGQALWQTVALGARPKPNWLTRLMGFARGRSTETSSDMSLAHQLRRVAQAIRQDIPESVFHVRLAGFDTHKDQVERGDSLRGAHADLLSVLASEVNSFWNEIRSLDQQNDVLLMTFSEFGRRLRENAAGGTDHGTAGPMFFLGGGIRAGIYGAHPGLSEEETDDVGDMMATVDFRSVYATVREKWLELPADFISGGPWKVLRFL